MKRLIISLTIIIFSIVYVNNVYAQTTPTVPKKACDLCGFCQGDTQAPGNYDACVQCVYPGVTPVFDRSNPTLLASPNKNNYYTALGCVATTAKGFTEFFLRLLASLVTGLGFLGIIYGGVQTMTARGDKNKIREGKNYIYASLFAIALVNFAVFIVKIIGQDILKLPFFG